MRVIETRFGTLSDGAAVRKFTVENDAGMRVSAMELGATITEVTVPDRTGAAANIVLGYPTLEGYVKGAEYFGCVIGRFANRIAAGRFSLDGKTYTLACNDGPHHSHGGVKGFDKRLWRGWAFRAKDAAGVRFGYTSPDGEEGYPGACRVTLEITLTERNELSFEYRAVSDQATPVNLTNHSYWNLAGAGSGTVYAQELTFNCPWYLPADKTLAPTGEVLGTAGTPFDFSKAKAIGSEIGAVPGGYDHCMVIGKPSGAMGHACTARDPGTGRAMEVHTTKPGFQLYTGNFLDGRPFAKHGSFCVETQYFPDSPNVGHFPDCILRPGLTYHHRTVHRFSWPGS